MLRTVLTAAFAAVGLSAHAQMTEERNAGGYDSSHLWKYGSAALSFDSFSAGHLQATGV